MGTNQVSPGSCNALTATARRFDSAGSIWSAPSSLYRGMILLKWGRYGLAATIVGTPGRSTMVGVTSSAETHSTHNPQPGSSHPGHCAPSKRSARASMMFTLHSVSTEPYRFAFSTGRVCRSASERQIGDLDIDVRPPVGRCIPPYHTGTATQCDEATTLAW